MSCDLTNGRLLNECMVGRAGIKTLFFAKLNDYRSVAVAKAGGEITDITGALTVFRFELADNVGNWEQALNAAQEAGTTFIEQTVLLTLFEIVPADLADLNNLKRGRNVVFALDFQDKIRALGETTGMTANGGSDMSGEAPGDKKGLDMTFIASENDYAPFLSDFTTNPFDNMTGPITVTPAY